MRKIEGSALCSQNFGSPGELQSEFHAIVIRLCLGPPYPMQIWQKISIYLSPTAPVGLYWLRFGAQTSATPTV